MTFAELQIGDVFEFDRTNVAFANSLAAGPWKKIGPRKYIRVEDNMLCTIGYIHTTVKAINQGE